MSWLNSDSNCYYIVEIYYRLSCLFQRSKIDKKHIFSTLKNNSTSKFKNIALDGKQLINPVKGSFKMCEYIPIFSCHLVGWLMISWWTYSWTKKTKKVSNIMKFCLQKLKKMMLIYTKGHFKTSNGKKHIMEVFMLYAHIYMLIKKIQYSTRTYIAIWIDFWIIEEWIFRLDIFISKLKLVLYHTVNIK